MPGPGGGPRPSRVRGGLDFTNGANNGFQALAADGAKAALRALTLESYTGKRVEYRSADVSDWAAADGPPPSSEAWRSGPSPLVGARFPFFVHDEVVAELSLRGAPHGADPAARRMAEVMVGVMSRYVPDVPVRAQPELMLRWSKGAKARWDEAGRLVPYDMK